jgi:hypothetical protein
LWRRPACARRTLKADGRMRLRSITGWLPCLLLLLAVPGEAQLVVKLSPQTTAAFDRYAQGVEAELAERWGGRKNFLHIEDNDQDKERVLKGDAFIKQMSNAQPVSIPDGLIHDWLGAVYIPRATVEQVMRVLEDFDKHKDIYPAVSASKTVARQGDEVTGYWQLKQRRMVPIILDVEEKVRYTRIAPGKWKGIAYARDITEVDTGLFSRGKKFPPGEGHGYLWRLYGYWSLESYQNGVLAECRTLSLSRDIPQGLTWAVGPYVQKMPEESLASTLAATRKAIAR